jgi:2-dehydro-3-deoxyphosphogluconate aldolase / (4S)-4-hydroxy-2-oxoglutarate aldolase
MPIEMLRRARVLPVLVIDDPADAVPLAIALRDAGISSLEVTLRRPGALDAIRRILAEVDGVAVGAGTVTTSAQLDQLHGLGAAFAVSPGTNAALVRRARELGLPYLPGVVTPSEVMAGLDLGLTAFKFFPAGAFGGLGALRAYAEVFSQAHFCPTGGVGPDNAGEYLALPNVVAVGSSWLAPADLVRARDWRAIGERAAAMLARLAPPAAS